MVSHALGWLVLVAVGFVAAGCGARPMPAGYAGDDARAFVSGNRALLQKEIRIGSGSTLYHLSVIAACQDAAELDRRLHRSYEEIFASAAEGNDVTRADVTNDEVAERVLAIMSENRELRCLALDLSRESELMAGRRHIGPRRPQVLRDGP